VIKNLYIYNILHILLTKIYYFINIGKFKNKFVGSKFIIKKIKTSDTLFILAPGNSINSYTENDFKKISEKDSIGINNFIVHDFNPSLYLLETQNRELNYFKILNNKKEKFKNSTFLYKGYASLNLNKYKNMKNNLEDIANNIGTFYFAKDAYLKGNWSKINQTFFNDFCKNDYLYNYRSSLDYAILLAYKCGYKNIVLCGFDMTDKYFYCENNKYFNMAKKYNLCKNINTIHNDTNRKNKIISFLEDINKTLKTSKNGGLFVYSKEMSLAKNLPIFKN